MITSAENRRWPGDHEIADPIDETGLPAPSMVRTAKIATVETRRAERIGAVNAALLTRVRASISLILGA